jgi:two-component system, LytTR family, response regulator
MPIDHRFFTRIPTIIVTAVLSMLLILLITYFGPSNRGWWDSPEFTWSNLLHFLFIDQILLECFSVSITFWFARILAEQVGWNRIPANRWGLVRYELLFLPVVLFAFFLFNPVTQTLRFMYHYLPELDWSVYRAEYGYSTELYLSYLPVVFLQIYGVVNVNILRHINGGKKESPDPNSSSRTLLEVRSERGRKMIPLETIHYCEKRERIYRVVAADATYTTSNTLTELERKLPPDDFVRINRSAIVRLEEVDYYAFWEHDKYVLKLRSGIEFVMSRQRLKRIKDQLDLVK